jgi:type IV pilus assembly protein PilX
MIKNRIANMRYRQAGAALVVGLVLLLVLTVLAISTMRTAALELIMAGNTQLRENAFQLAESGIDNTVQGVASGAIPLEATEGWQADLGTTRIDALNGQFETNVRFLSEGPAYGGFSPSEFQFLHFQVDATGRTDQRGARSFQSQGIYRIAPRSAGAE